MNKIFKRYEEENFHLMLMDSDKMPYKGHWDWTSREIPPESALKLLNHRRKNGEDLRLAVVCGENSRTEEGDLLALDFDLKTLKVAGRRKPNVAQLRTLGTLVRFSPHGGFSPFYRASEKPDNSEFIGLDKIRWTNGYVGIPPGHGWWLDGMNQKIAKWNGISKARLRALGFYSPVDGVHRSPQIAAQRISDKEFEHQVRFNVGPHANNKYVKNLVKTYARFEGPEYSRKKIDEAAEQMDISDEEKRFAKARIEYLRKKRGLE